MVQQKIILHVQTDCNLFWKLFLVCAWVISSSLSPSRVDAQSISWMEDFALSKDRESKLAELIPGSDDYFFYHCLHYQNTNQLDQSEVMLTQWLAEHSGRETASIRAMVDRQRLLTYQENPRRTIDHFVRRLGIQLNHPAPPAKNEQRFPAELDPAVLQPQRLVIDALRRRQQLKPLALDFLAQRFMANQNAGLPIQLSDLLQRVNAPIVDGLEELVIRELRSRNPADQKFGDRAAHQLLTREQLGKVAEALPRLAQQNSFVTAFLRRLRPPAGVDISVNDEERLRYLLEVDAYVNQLPATFNHLKAASIYRLLEFNHGRGDYDLQLFLRYLNLPRVSPIVPREWSGKPNRADLNQDFQQMALLSRIGNEQPLVRAYLEHFLKDAPNTNEFSGLILEDYLQRVFAETKLMNGIGDEQVWYRVLKPAERQQLRDRKELRLSANNIRLLNAEAKSVLRVDLKNISELMVRVYELNTESFYRTHEEDLDTDLDLDGLVATSERSLKFSQPAIIRHREEIDLSSITGRGVWIVDLVGDGLRARALLRKGSIDHVDGFSADGMSFTVIDENRKPIPGAVMWVGKQLFRADEQGKIVIPPVMKETQRHGVISDGKISNRFHFPHLEEKYSLQAGMHIDRTQMLSGRKTEIVIRPRLLLGEKVIDPQILENVSLRVRATDQSGLPITFEESELELDQNSELVVPVRVPQRLASLTAVLSGTVPSLIDGSNKRLEIQHEWQVSEIRKTDQVHDSYLTRNNNNFLIEVRGRNGELVPGVMVSIALTTEYSTGEINLTLQTAPNGRINLGELANVSEVRHAVVGGIQHIQSMSFDQLSWPNQLNTASQSTIKLPWPKSDDRVLSRFRLSELRETSIAADRSAIIKQQDGFLVIEGLTTGDYSLVDRHTGVNVSISVTEGPVFSGVIAGESQHRTLSQYVPLSIGEIQRDEKSLRIQLTGVLEGARVHLYASRFLDSSFPSQALRLPETRAWGRSIESLQSAYVSDLRLGDEYRYVLRRRFVKKYPGVMLPMPGLLLNPWETEETTNQTQEARPGEAVPPSSKMKSAAQLSEMMDEAMSAQLIGSSEYDFQADPGVILSNLRPDQDGWVTVDAKSVNGLPIVRVVVSNATTILEREVPAPLTDVETVDLRLASSLDISNAYTMERSVTIAGPEQPLDLTSLGSAQLQIYGTVQDLLKLYLTLVPDPRLDDFSELASWGSMAQSEKIQIYDQLASHELHLFLRAYDPDFFQEVVRRHLANKKEKQFIDHWLLENDLSAYRSIGRYHQLNIAEKVLFAFRDPQIRDTVISELEQSLANEQAKFDQVARNIDIALAGKSMEAGGGMGGGANAFRGRLNSNLSESLSMDQQRRGLERMRRRVESASEDADMDMADPGITGGRKVFLGRELQGGRGGETFYQDVDRTKQWAESQWDQVRTVGPFEPKSLVSLNSFWLDLAKQAQQNPEFVRMSKHLLLPAENRHAALVALALSGLPLQAGEIGLPTDEADRYQPAHEVAVVTKRLKKLEVEETDQSVLIGQRISPVHGEQVSPNERSKSEEPESFVVGIPYRGQIVISNPTAKNQIIELFWQIPEGSIPLSGTEKTSNQTLKLNPFEMSSVSYTFYFPNPGKYQQYPATVSKNETLIARSDDRVITVLKDYPKNKELDWNYLATQGSPTQIRKFLVNANVQNLDWMRIASRMRNQEIYQVVIEKLASAKLPIQGLWAYGFLHEDEEAIQTYFSLLNPIHRQVGPVLRSPLLNVDPIEQRLFETLEYSPLVRARIHRLGDRHEILNPTFRRQYEEFIKLLGYQDTIKDSDRLLLSYYLLIQNRISESIEQFSEVRRESVSEKLQYDYLSAYLSLHQGNLEAAQILSRQYVNYPITRWRVRFDELKQKLGQVNSLMDRVDRKDEGTVAANNRNGDLRIDDRNQRMSDASEQTPVIVVGIDGNQVRLDYRNTTEATVNYYGVDLELLFSKAPFAREDLQRMAMVRPKLSQQLQLEENAGSQEFLIDSDLQTQTLLVEVESGAARSTVLYYGGGLVTYVSEAFGQLQVSQRKNQLPVAEAYVKVYAKYPDGSVRFFKDGYTDLRGRFDYASISADEAKGATKYSILVLSEEFGASLQEAGNPTR